MSRFWLLLAMATIFLGCNQSKDVALQPMLPPSNNPIVESSPDDAKRSLVLKAVVDDLDKKLNINAFGDVNCRGSRCEITLEPGYYSELEDVAKPKALETIASFWRDHYKGVNVVYKNKAGDFVAEL